MIAATFGNKEKTQTQRFCLKKYPDDPEIVNIAKLGLKDHIEMLPKLYIGDDWDSGYIASWFPKALKYLGKNYKTRDR